MKIMIELRIKENKFPHIFSELEHKVYQLHLLGFSRANISLMLQLNYKYVKCVIVSKTKTIITMIREAYKEVEEIEEKVRVGEIEVCDKWKGLMEEDKK